MEFIILMIVVSVVANIIKSANQGKQQTKPAGRGRRPGFPERGAIPGRNFPLPGNIPGFDTYPMGQSDFPMDKSRRQEEALQEHRYDSVEAPADFFAKEPVPQADLSQPAAPMGTAQRLQVIDLDHDPKHKLEFTGDSIINGIIMSEVLGQPKSRR